MSEAISSLLPRQAFTNLATTAVGQVVCVWCVCVSSSVVVLFFLLESRCARQGCLAISIRPKGTTYNEIVLPMDLADAGLAFGPYSAYAFDAVMTLAYAIVAAKQASAASAGCPAGLEGPVPS